MTRGIELVTAERIRQIEEEGFTPDHDFQHKDGELSQAACYYAACTVHCTGEHGDIYIVVHPTLFYPNDWSAGWQNRQGKERPTVRDLTKAAALLIAEIDRRLAAGEE